jgi:hypothetical protein
VHSWQNIPILLAYDVLVAAAFHKLVPFGRLVYEDNDNDKGKTRTTMTKTTAKTMTDDGGGDRDDDDDNKTEAAAAAATATAAAATTTGVSTDYLLVSFIMRPDCNLYKHKFTGSQHLKYI